MRAYVQHTNGNKNKPAIGSNGVWNSWNAPAQFMSTSKNKPGSTWPRSHTAMTEHGLVRGVRL